MSLAYYAPDFGPDWEQTARVLADEFDKIGLDVRLEPLQIGAFVEQITIGGQLEDMAIGSLGADPDRTDPNFWLVALSTCESPRNAVHWCDPAYDELAFEQRRTTDENRRIELVQEAQLHFQEQLPWWHITHFNSGILYNSDKWSNATPAAPLSVGEVSINPWLNIEPLGDDRVLDVAHLEQQSTYNYLTEASAQGWLRMIYDPMLNYDGSDLVPWAVSEWTFTDDTTLDLQLREGMTFHDGVPVTAADAVYTINLILELEPPALSDAVQGIASAEQTGETTFRLHLEEPNPGILRQALTDIVILPMHIVEGIDDPLAWEPSASDEAIGSGPFVFESWEPNQRHVLSVHSQHWAAPNYDGINLLALGQGDAIQAAMLDGSADLTYQGLPDDAMQRIGEEEEFLDFVVSGTFAPMMVWVNHEKAPFSDLEFRRALRLMTNKERIAAEAQLGLADVAGEGNVPNDLTPWYTDELVEIPYDLEEARRVLADAGYGWDDAGRLHFPAGSD